MTSGRMSSEDLRDRSIERLLKLAEPIVPLTGRVGAKRVDSRARAGGIDSGPGGLVLQH